MKSIDWTPGFSSRSFKGVLKAGLPWEHIPRDAQTIKSVYNTGETSVAKDEPGMLQRQKNAQAELDGGSRRRVPRSRRMFRSSGGI